MVHAASLTSLANAAGYLCRFAAQILVIRLLAGYGGEQFYGVVATLQAIAAAVLVLDLGLTLALKNHLISLGPDPQLRRACIRDALYLLFLMAGLLLIVAALVAWSGAPSRLIDDPLAVRPWHQGLLFFGYLSLSALQLPQVLPRVILASRQREYALWPLSIAGPLLGAGLTWGLVLGDAGLELAALAMPAALLMTQAAGWFLLGADRPSVRRPRELAGSLLLLRQGWQFFVIQVAVIGITQSPVLIINGQHGNAAAGRFALHYQLFMWLGLGLALLVTPYWTPVREAFVAGRNELVRTIVVRLSVLTAVGGVVSCLVLGSVGESLVWLMSKGVYVWDRQLAWSLAVQACISGVFSVGAMALGACGIVTGPMRVILLQCPLTLACSWFGGVWFGPLGVVLGAVLAYLVTSGWYIPWRLHRLLHAPPP